MKRLILAAALVCLPLAALGAITQVATASVSCGTAPTLLATSLDIKYARALVVTVPSSAGASVFIGPAGVTTSSGIEVEPGKTYASGERLDGGVRLYCVAASATAVRVMEAY